MADFGKYFASTNAITGSASAQNLVSIENPIDSTTNLLIHKLDVRGVLTGNSNVLFNYHCSRTSGLPSGGTVGASIKQRSTDADPNGTIRQAPTGSLIAGQVWSTMPPVPIVVGSLLVGITAGPDFLEPIFDAASEEDSIILAPGEGLMVTVDGNATTWRHRVRILWSESLV